MVVHGTTAVIIFGSPTKFLVVLRLQDYFDLCTILYHPINSVAGSLALTTTTGPQHLGGVGEGVADELQCIKMSRTVRHKEAQAYHSNLPTTPAVLGQSHQRQTSRCRTDCRPLLGKTHLDYHCQGKLDNRFYIQWLQSHTFLYIHAC